jgi:riboflavin synthase alpha subunit
MEAGCALRIDKCGWAHRPEHGASIAVNGCCLTVVSPPGAIGQDLCFHVVHQTLRVTTLGDLRPGDVVNLEHAVTASTLLGGHIVQGHVDGVGRVMRIVRGQGDHRVRVEPPDVAAMALIVDKGSIAVRGVSLTVAQAGESWFEVALIPTTLDLTNLGDLREGDRVNLEYDYIAKVVANWLQRSALIREGRDATAE